MTKKVINLNGEVEIVEDNVIVKTVNGIHYLLTTAEIIEYDNRQTQAVIEKADYEANHKYKDDRAKIYAPIKEQLEMLYKDKKYGTNTFVEHNDFVRSEIPKPT